MSSRVPAVRSAPKRGIVLRSSRLIVAHLNESYHIWVRSHMSHVTRMNESCHTHEGVMSQTWMSHVTHTNEPCHTRAWVRACLLSGAREQGRYRRGAADWSWHVTESCHEWVKSHIHMSPVTNERIVSHTRLVLTRDALTRVRDRRVTYETSLDKRCLDKSSWQVCHKRCHDKSSWQVCVRVRDRYVFVTGVSHTRLALTRYVMTREWMTRVRDRYAFVTGVSHTRLALTRQESEWQESEWFDRESCHVRTSRIWHESCHVN